jgi:hypothetical protein
MAINYINNFLKIALNIADYYDNKGNNGEDFLNDEMTKEIGLRYRALTSYLRKGVQEVITLQSNYHKACEQRNYEKSIQEEQKDFLLDMFGDEEPYSINDKDKQRIKEFVQSIFKEWDDKENEDGSN